MDLANHNLQEYVLYLCTVNGNDFTQLEFFDFVFKKLFYRIYVHFFFIFLHSNDNKKGRKKLSVYTEALIYIYTLNCRDFPDVLESYYNRYVLL